MAHGISDRPPWILLAALGLTFVAGVAGGYVAASRSSNGTPPASVGGAPAPAHTLDSRAAAVATRPSASTVVVPASTAPRVVEPVLDAAAAPVPVAPGNRTVREVPSEQPETVAVVWDHVVVRATPRHGAVVGQLVRGERVTLGARVSGWFEVRSPAVSGWVFGAAVGR